MTIEEKLNQLFVGQHCFNTQHCFHAPYGPLKILNFYARNNETIYVFVHPEEIPEKNCLMNIKRLREICEKYFNLRWGTIIVEGD